LVAAASITSMTSRPSLSSISANSFISAMFRSRCVFSMILAASAVMMSRTGTTPALLILA